MTWLHRRAFLRTSVLAWVAASLGPASARASTVIAMDVRELARASDALVLAVVGDARPADRPGRTYTDSDLRVEEVLGGDAPSVVTVRQMGGVRGDRTIRVPGDAELVSGQRVIAFVREVDGQWYLTALSQSVWTVDGRGPDAPIRQDLDGLTRVERAPSGRVVDPTVSLPVYATLGELRAACEGLTFGSAR